MASIETNWRYHNLQVVRIENDQLYLDILPELGAKIYNFVHKPSGVNVLWHNPHLLPERAPFGASFDDHWSGGWDELLPNDLPCPAPGGDLLPDHGEVWAQEAEWRVLETSGTSSAVRFTNYGRVLPTRFEKTVELHDGEGMARLHYEWTNLGGVRIPFLWNIHPALAIKPDAKLYVPARRAITDPWRENHFLGGTEFEWPWATGLDGNRVDLRRVLPKESGAADMHYLVDVEEGWYAVPDLGDGIGFGLVFPKETFRHVWLFRTYGGWRGLYTLILEASTGYPYDLSVAAQNGACGWLEPGACLKADVLALALERIKSIKHISEQGIISAE